MRKNIAFCLMLVLSLLLAACSSSAEKLTAVPITSPEQYLQVFPEADIIIGEEDSFFVEATRVPWIMHSLDFTDTTAVGKVKRSGIREHFRAWDATVLTEGTEIMRHNNEGNVMIAKVEGKPLPYLRYVAPE